MRSVDPIPFYRQISDPPPGHSRRRSRKPKVVGSIRIDSVAKNRQIGADRVRPDAEPPLPEEQTAKRRAGARATRSAHI